MISGNVKDTEVIEMTETSYQGEKRKVINTQMRWLTHRDLGDESYLHNHALRQIIVGPSGYIPTHNHKHTHIWYMLSGSAVITAINKAGETEEKTIGPGDFVYHYSYEPHSFRNNSSEPAVFLCCIDCIDDKKNCAP
jgi:quercetin dioxygenase-like cupin family protein